MTSPTAIPASPTPAVDVAGLSREGRRASNEDSAAWVAYGPGSAVAGYVVVCDGMGGHNAGEVASSMALRLLQERIGELASEPAGAVDPAVLASRVGAWIAEINLAICRSAAANRDHSGMGTTLALALVTSDGRLVVANVGDSRIFLVRGVVVQQLSVDHTALAEQRRILNKDGGSSLDDASNPFFHALTRSLGQEAEVSPDIRADLALKPGDLLVVTSDGVTDVLESERFLSIVEGSRSLDEVAETTYRLSFEGGSKDNITVALLASGRPTRLGTAPSSSEEVDLDGTIPLVRPRVVPRPVSGGTAMADAGRAPAAPPPAGSRKGLRTPLLVAGAVFLGCLAALAFWLTSGPSVRPVEPVAASTPAADPVVATPTPMPAPPTPAPTAPVSLPSAEGYALPGEEGARPREVERPRTPIQILRVPTAAPRPERQAPSLPPLEPAPSSVRPTPQPAAPTAVAKPSVPEPAVAEEQKAADRPGLAVPGAEARLVGVEVHVHTRAKKYKFIFRFDRPVQEPGADYKLQNGQILVANVKRDGEKLVNSGDRYFKGVPLRYDTAGSKARAENSLEFNLLFSATLSPESSPLVDGESLQLDLKGLEGLFGRSSIEARVVRK